MASTRAQARQLGSIEGSARQRAKDADTDQAADIASSFEQALHVAFNADKRLGNTITRQSIRGSDPTLSLLEYAKKTYVGLDLFMDIWMNDDVTFDA